MKKLFSIILMLCFICLTAEAKVKDKDISKIIKNSGISTNSVSISVKNLDNGRIVYALNDRILMHPASVQKIMTIVPIIQVLGEDYNLTTELYSRGNGEYVIKLGADPYLTHSDLKTLIEKIEPDTTKKIYIDSSIIEKKDWGEGWQWDDDLNTSITRFNSYNLDRNIIKLTVMPTEYGKQATIINPSRYPLAFLNYVVTGDKNEVKISRDNVLASNTLKLEGTVKTPYTQYIPNNNLRRYFEIKLKNALEDNKVYLKEAYSNTTVTSKDEKIDEISHPISIAIEDILKNSNNMSIESISKIAAGKYYNKQGTDVDAINLFNKFCEQNGLDNSRIKIVDASGVSKNNLADTDFITDFLVKNQDSTVLEKMTEPGTGTLSHRMLPLKNNLKAKTGTLSDISSIAGFLTAKNGNKYAFCIIINDPSSNSSGKKNLEDYLIRELYMKL